MSPFRSKVKHISISQWYALTKEAKDTKKEKFDAKVAITFNQVQRLENHYCQWWLLCKKIIKDNVKITPTIGWHGHGIKNNNGVWVIELSPISLVGTRVTKYVDHILVKKLVNSCPAQKKLITNELRIKLKCQSGSKDYIEFLYSEYRNPSSQN